MLKALSKSMVGLTLSWALTCSAHQSNVSCRAWVYLDSASAERFVEMLPTVNVMPLSGAVVASGEGTATVEVSCDLEYCSANDLNDFDVARWLSRLTAYDPWNIRRISASIDY